MYDDNNAIYADVNQRQLADEDYRVVVRHDPRGMIFAYEINCAKEELRIDGLIDDWQNAEDEIEQLIVSHSCNLPKPQIQGSEPPTFPSVSQDNGHERKQLAIIAGHVDTSKVDTPPASADDDSKPHHLNRHWVKIGTDQDVMMGEKLSNVRFYYDLNVAGALSYKMPDGSMQMNPPRYQEQVPWHV